MKRREFIVERIPATSALEKFEELYFRPCRPVIIESVASRWPATTKWTPSFLRSLVSESRNIRPYIYWFELSGGALAEDYEVPTILRALLDRAAGAPQVRLWISAQGFKTPWHYDGGSVHGLNVQVAGSKRFTLVSPETPLPCGPLWFECTSGMAQPERILTDRHIFTSFVLRPGDALFLPQHWFHFVESLDPVNINLNWVWTDLSTLSESKIPWTTRERESVAGMYAFVKLVERLRSRGTAYGQEYYRRIYVTVLRYLKTYGGVPNYGIVKKMAEDVSGARLALRLARELYTLPSFLRTKRDLQRADEADFGAPRRAGTFFDTENARQPKPSAPS